MSAEATVLDGQAAPATRGLPIWVLVSGFAATGALVGAPLAATRGALSPLALVLAGVAPVLLVVGAWRAAPSVLLGCVPVAWALPGLTTAAPASVWTPAMIGTGLLAAASYFVATGMWARGSWGWWASLRSGLRGVLTVGRVARTASLPRVRRGLDDFGMVSLLF